MFPVMKITPNKPASHIHHGPASADAGSSGCGPSVSEATSVTSVPTVNETSDARNGVPTAMRRRLLTAVWIGVTAPTMTPRSSNGIRNTSHDR